MIPDKFERNGKFFFVESWRFPIPVEKFIKDLFKSLYIPEKMVCHVCSGKSRIGGLRIDLDISLKPDIACDVLDLPWILGENSQEHVLADLPWQISYGARRYFSYAMRDICKEGGFILINSPWYPWVKGLKFLRTYKVGQTFNSYRDLVDLWLFQKMTNHEVRSYYGL